MYCVKNWQDKNTRILIKYINIDKLIEKLFFEKEKTDKGRKKATQKKNTCSKELETGKKHDSDY